MGISLSLVNFSELFTRTGVQPIVVNDLSCASESDREYHDRLISVKYEKTDLFSNEPHCECGKLSGGYKIGMICTNCRSAVREHFDQPLKPIAWIRSPKGVERLINPVVWTMLSKRFTKSHFNFIEWICNTDYSWAGSKPMECAELNFMGLERGYNNFVRRFDEYIDMLYSLKHFRPKKGKEEYLARLLVLQKDCVFSNHVPLPNKALLVIEDTKVGTFVDPLMIDLKDAILTISSIDAPLSTLTVRQKENRAAKTISMLAGVYLNAYSEIFSEKNGIFRKHIFGTRNHFSARAVITSNTGAHKYDELHIAWGLAVTMLKIHLTTKLMQRGWTPNDINALLLEYTVKYHPLLDRLFKELIDESPDKGLVCMFSRNPSLARGSTQRMRITVVKTDPNDPTITLSILAVKKFNAFKLGHCVSNGACEFH